MDRGGGDVVGVLGGMGPLATADFYNKLISRTGAATEAENVRTAIWSDPTIPDRTLALLGRGPSPVPAMVSNTRALLALGASVIVMPCNTAHAFLPEVVARTGGSFVNMIGETVAHCVQEYPHAQALGVLSTEGTKRTGLYRKAAAGAGLHVVEPTTEEQDRWVSSAIHLVKTGGSLVTARAIIEQAADALVARGADVVIAACTELPLILDERYPHAPIVDATDCLAQATVNRVRPFARAS